MIADILIIALQCIILGGASIPFSFGVNSNPVVVWFGNALGSALSAIVVIYIGDRITDKKFKDKVSKNRAGKKVVKAFDEGSENPKTQKVGSTINKHGLRLFSLFCPIFPGVTLSTVAVYALDLDKKIFKRWMLVGVVFVSGIYVFGYWYFFVK
jgi:hypothetical protein